MFAVDAIAADGETDAEFFCFVRFEGRNDA
jgi:hypothetical protein